MRKQKWQTYPQRHNKSGVTVCQARVECQAEIISYRRLNLAILRIKYFVGNFSKFGELIRVQWQSMEGLLHIIITFSPTTNTHLALVSNLIIFVLFEFHDRHDELRALMDLELQRQTLKFTSLEPKKCSSLNMNEPKRHTISFNMFKIE